MPSGRILIDLLTPKHVLFFEPVASRLRSMGFRVLLTGRRFRETLWAIRSRGLEVKVVGEYGGGSLKGKLKASLERSLELLEVFEGFNPDAVLCFSSPEASRLAFGLGIPLYLANDSPHAEAVARLTVPLARRLYTPKVIPVRCWARYGARDVVRYDALDPAAWLKRFKPDPRVPEKLGLNVDSDILVVRFEESKSSYLLGLSKPLAPRLVKNLLEYNPKVRVVVLPRYEDQVQVLEGMDGRVTVCRDPVDAASLIYYASVFVGFGGTMTCEAGLLGTPTVTLRVYGSYYTERYLEKRRLVEAAYSLEDCLEKVKALLGRWRRVKPRLRARAKRILDGMEDPSRVIAENLALDLKSLRS